MYDDRNNRFDDILKRFIQDNGVIVLDHINNEKIPPTYYRQSFKQTFKPNKTFSV